MNWYFFRDGNIVGPFSREELIIMKNCNVINENVLVCSMDANKEMQWLPFNRALNESVPMGHLSQPSFPSRLDESYQQPALMEHSSQPSSFSNGFLNENEKEVVILGMSYKNGKRCVGGIDVNTSEWIRLVSSEEDDSDGIPENYLQNVWGPGYRTDVQVLDVLRVQLKKRLHKKIQTENWLIDMEQEPEKVADLVDKYWLEQFVSNEPIFGGVEYYIQNGYDYNKSLTLHKVYNVNVHCYQYQDDNGNWHNRKKVDFTYQNKEHQNWSLTDPDVIKQMQKHDGDIHCDEAYMVVSISEKPWHNKWYKYVASIIPLDQFVENSVYDEYDEVDIPFYDIPF